MEQLIILVLSVVHQTCALVKVNIVAIVVRQFSNQTGVFAMVTTQFKVTLVTVFRHVTISVMVLVVCMMFVSPVVGAVLNAMMIVMIVNMLRVVLTIIIVRVIVAEVVVSLWLDVVILTKLFACKVSMIVKVRDMILQVPVALLEVSFRVMFVSTSQLLHFVTLIGMCEFIRSLFVIVVHSSESCKVLSIIGTLLLLLLFLGLIGTFSWLC